MTELTHSYTSIKMFKNCPKRYYHQRIAKVVREVPGEATVWGERAHKSLEDYLVSEGDTPLIEGVDHLQGMLDAIRADSSKVLHAELEMTLNKQLEPTGWWDADAWLRSKLDVFIEGKRSAITLDYKTGKRRPDFDQLEMFALQVFAHYAQIERVTSSFVWVRDKTLDTRVYTREDAPVLWAKLLGDIRRIEKAAEADNWPARPSGLCGWCPCKDFCEYAAVRR